MCGITACIGKDTNNISFVMTGLKRLEYRGYDSAGIAFFLKRKIKVVKTKGKVSELENKLTHSKYLRTKTPVTMGHTRWATHGEPSDINSHPHQSKNGTIAIVHNGIIENADALKEMLKNEGYTCVSQTDTEVMAHLIEFLQTKNNYDLLTAVTVAMSQIKGACAFLIMSEKNSKTLIAVRRGSPLVIGQSAKANFVASSESAFLGHVDKIYHMQDNEIAEITAKDFSVTTLDGKPVTTEMEELTGTLEQIEKGSFKHFMLKEIYEQPITIKRTLVGRKGRVNQIEGELIIGGITQVHEQLTQAKQAVILACGTSYHAGAIAKLLFQQLAGLTTSVEYASEFTLSFPQFSPQTIPIAISQSGETKDTLLAAQMAKGLANGLLLGVCNVVGTQLPKLTTAGSYLHVGPEIGVASTKAFTGQVSVLIMWALKMAELRGKISPEELSSYLDELVNIPRKIERILEQKQQIQTAVNIIKDSNHCLFLGRGYGYPVALEGALKLKEISYVHAEALSLGEMKHGPIALVDENMPVIVIATKDAHYEKTMSNIHEIKSRKGKVIAIVSEGDSRLSEIASHVIEIPKTIDFMSPLLSVIPLQLIAYEAAVALGKDPDQPRNLAKSVTVE